MTPCASTFVAPPVSAHHRVLSACQLLTGKLTRGLIALALMTVTVSVLAQAEPPHPILTIPTVANSTTSANTILSSWNETNYVNNFVPHSSPRDDYGGFAGNPVVGDTSWSWSTATPHQITSKPSNIVFPGAAGYTQYTQAVTVLDGSTVQVPYYFAAGSTTVR